MPWGTTPWMVRETATGIPITTEERLLGNSKESRAVCAKGWSPPPSSFKLSFNSGGICDERGGWRLGIHGKRANVAGPDASWDEVRAPRGDPFSSWRSEACSPRAATSPVRELAAH